MTYVSENRKLSYAEYVAQRKKDPHHIRFRITSESPNFFAAVGVGALSPGYIHIRPKGEYTNFSEIPPELRAECIEFCKDTTNVLQGTFNAEMGEFLGKEDDYLDVIFSENGPTLENADCSCAEIAHLHFSIVPKAGKEDAFREWLAHTSRKTALMPRPDQGLDWQQSVAETLNHRAADKDVDVLVEQGKFDEFAKVQQKCVDGTYLSPQNITKKYLGEAPVTLETYFDILDSLPQGKPYTTIGSASDMSSDNPHSFCISWPHEIKDTELDIAFNLTPSSQLIREILAKNFGIVPTADELEQSRAAGTAVELWNWRHEDHKGHKNRFYTEAVTREPLQHLAAAKESRADSYELTVPNSHFHFGGVVFLPEHASQVFPMSTDKSSDLELERPSTIIPGNVVVTLDGPPGTGKTTVMEAMIKAGLPLDATHQGQPNNAVLSGVNNFIGYEGSSVFKETVRRLIKEEKFSEAGNAIVFEGTLEDLHRCATGIEISDLLEPDSAGDNMYEHIAALKDALGQPTVSKVVNAASRTIAMDHGNVVVGYGGRVFPKDMAGVVSVLLTCPEHIANNRRTVQNIMAQGTVDPYKFTSLKPFLRTVRDAGLFLETNYANAIDTTHRLPIETVSEIFKLVQRERDNAIQKSSILSLDTRMAG